MTFKTKHLPMAVIAAIGIVLLGFANWGRDMGADAKDLIGMWLKQSSDPCARIYPTHLILAENGTYDAPGAQDEGAYWHGGEWQIAPDGQLSIQLANDANLSYSVEVPPDGSLVITDDQQCQVVYTRDG